MSLSQVKILNPHSFENGFKANYIINEPVNISKSSTGVNNLRLFIAAKEVETIDGYAADQNINKFDLVMTGMVLLFYKTFIFVIIIYSRFQEILEQL